MDLGHRQVLVQIVGRPTYVDEGAARLIEHLWANGIDTIGSCQNAAAWLPQLGPEASGLVAVIFRVRDYRRMLRLFGIEHEWVSRNTFAILGSLPWTMRAGALGLFREPYRGSRDVPRTKMAPGRCCALHRSRSSVRPLGFEPRTCGLRVRCSAVELEARVLKASSVAGMCGGPEFLGREGDRRGSNPRPPGPHPGALPTELRPPRSL